MKKLIATFASMLMAFVVSACETTGRSAVTLMSDYDYLRSSPEKQQADDEAVASLIRLDRRREQLLRAYLPVPYGDDRTGYTLQCIYQPGEFNAIATYPGHNPPGMDGMNHEAMMMVQADKECNIIYKKGPKNEDGSFGAVAPNILLANVVTNKDMMRELLTGAVPAVLNGTGAALIAGATDCNEGCGMSLVVQGGNGGTAVSAANSLATSGANVNVRSPCASGSCEGLPSH